MPRSSTRVASLVLVGLLGTEAIPAAAGPQDGAWTALAPPPRSMHARIAYDSNRHRLLLYSGYPSYRVEVYALPLSGPRTWTRVAVAGAKPSPRSFGSLIYDPVRDRLIHFGGAPPLGQPTNEVWALQLGGVPTWQQLSPAGSLPAARLEHSAIYDPVRDRMIVFGGYIAGNPTSNVVSLSLAGPTQWTSFPLSNTTATSGGHFACYDAAEDRMLVYPYGGGSLRALDFGATAQDVSSWSNLPAPPAPVPAPRHDSGVTWVASRRQIVVFGGTDNTTYFSDVWALSVDPSPTWTQLSPGTTITGRVASTAAHDPVADKLIVFGGSDLVGAQNDTWELALSPVGSLTLVRSNPVNGRDPAMIMDPGGSRAIVFERDGTWQALADGEPLWSPLVLTGPKPSSGQGAIHDPVRNRMVIFGSTSVRALDLAGPGTWGTLSATGTPPLWEPPIAVYDPARDRALVWDGTPAKGVWQFSLAAPHAWTPIATTGSPPSQRSRPRTVYDAPGDRLVVCGGVGITDAWTLTLGGTPTWAPLAVQGTPPAPRAEASWVLDVLGRRVLLFGGGLGGVDALALDGTPTWSALAPAGVDLPSATTTLMGAVYDAAHDRVITYGGEDGGLEQSQSFELAFSGIVDAPRPSETVGALSFTRVLPDPGMGPQRLEWSRPVGEGARLEVFSVAGRRVWSGSLPATVTQATWDGRDHARQPVAPGIYVVRISGAHGTASRRLVRLR